MTTKLAGIDLGTGRTKVAVPDTTGNPVIQANASGELYTPSVVYFDRDRIVVGVEALHAGLADPSRCVRHWKRHMGTDTVLYTDENGKTYGAPDIARILLADVAANHQSKTGQPLADVAISVPANYNDRQKHETKAAAESLGLNVVVLPHEPTAAILGNQLQLRGDGLVLVFDLGDGTLDCSVGDISGNNISIVTTDGETDLGGQDFSALIEEILLRRFEEQHGFRPNPDEHPLELQDVRLREEQVKVTLSTRESAPAFVSCGGKILNTIVTRAEFEDSSRDLVARAMGCVERTLKDAGIGIGALAEIVLAGGASQMPMFPQAFESRFGRKPAAVGEPHFAAAKGNVYAARMELERQGKAVFVGNRKLPPLDLHARDVTSHPIGVKVVADGGKFLNSVVLGKGVPIPSDRTEGFLLAERGQTGALIELLQGPDGVPAEKCLQLGHFELTDLDAVDGDHRVDIRLKIDLNGMLSATAYDPNSGRSADLSIDYRRGVGSDKPARRKTPA